LDFNSIVDDLHTQAGSKNVIELHGNIFRVNTESTWLSKSADFSLKGPASDILPKICNLLKSG